MTRAHLSRGLNILAGGLAVFLSLFQIWFTAGFGFMDNQLMRVVHLGLIMVLIFLSTRPSMHQASPARQGFDLVLRCVFALGSIAIMVFYALHLDEITARMLFVDDLTAAQLVYGLLAVVLVLEATRRTAGMALVVVALCFIGYALAGPWLPGALGHRGVKLGELVEYLFLTTEGIYGIPLGVAAGMIYAFVMFGAFLDRTKMSSVFMDLACLLTRRSRGGPAKVSIFASALFGSISGSAPANVYATGTFTIPLMQRVGYAPAFAGAVEAVASTGGQIMPPIMGAAAFIMADLMNVSYLTVAKAAILPAVLYYLALFMMIHFEAVNKNLGSLPADQVPDARSVLSRLYYVAPILVLIAVIFSGRSVINSAFISIAFTVFLSFFRKETRLTLKGFAGALELTARNALMISACCACAGIVVAVIVMTGVGHKFINGVTDIVGDNLPLLMLCVMVTCIILGMGVPTSPAYIIVATLGAPALTKAGVPLIAAHMFVFYYAILSVITPPVCIAAYSGAAIAGAPAMRTGTTAVKLGIVAFIIPFMFVFQPALLWQGPLGETIPATLTAIIGVIGIAGGMQGHFREPCRMWERAALFLGGLTLVYPGLVTDLAGATLILGVLACQSLRRKVPAAQPAP